MRYPQTTALSRSGTGYSAKSFKTTKDLEDFLARQGNQLEWEPVVPFRATDVLIEEDVQEAITKDPFLANQWPLANQGVNQLPGADIDALRANSIQKDASQVVFYVMDSGIDVRHPDLQGSVTSFFDAFDVSTTHPVDLNGHGTHVASIVGARGDNDFGTRGVVPGNIEIVSVRFLNANNLGDSSTAIKAVEFMESDMERRRLEDPNVNFVGVNSWGGEVYSSALEEAMQRLSAYGYIPITSAGNLGRNIDKSMYFPCSFELRSNICVAASTSLDTLASFSNYGAEQVGLMAPGEDVFSIISGKIISGDTYQARYQRKSGTSQAVPHVAGVVGLMWAANPELSDLQIKEILLRSVDRLPGGENYVLSGGRLNAYRALLLATGQDPTLADRALGASTAVEAQNQGGGGGCHLSPHRPSSGLYLVFLFALFLLFFRRLQTLKVVNSTKR